MTLKEIKRDLENHSESFKTESEAIKLELFKLQYDIGRLAGLQAALDAVGRNEDAEMYRPLFEGTEELLDEYVKGYNKAKAEIWKNIKKLMQ